MMNSSMPKMPGMGSMTETFEFVKNLWGGAGKQAMGIPGMVMPTMSLEEVDKQIKDLKAVESWLTVNMNMLRGTIQALEVQSATISALQTMGQNFSAAVSSAGGDTTAQKAHAAAATAASEKAEERRQSREAMKEEFKSGAEKSAEQPAESAPDQPAAADTAGTAGLAGNPAHWWNLLQDQFKQAVSTAMTPEAISSMNTMGNAAKSAMESMAQSIVHPAAKPEKAAPAKPAAKTVKKTAAKAATKTATKPAAKKVAKRKPAAKS